METPTCFMDDSTKWLGKHKTLPVMPNGFPIGPLHLLLVAPEHREELRMEDLESANDFARTFPHYLVFHNMRGTGATRPDHLHFQALLRDEALPLEAAPRRLRLSWNGTEAFRLVEYPAYALAFRGAHAATAAFECLRALRPTPFNLVMNGREVVVVPRRTERPAGFPNLFGGLEMAGCVILSDEERYRQVGHAEIAHALAECGFACTEEDALEERLLGTLYLPEEESLLASVTLARSP